MSSLITHCGAATITRDELSAIEAPEGTDTWFPIPHTEVLEKTEAFMKGAGYSTEVHRLAVGRKGLEFFGVLNVESEFAEGTNLTVGLRNSNNKKFPIGFCIGSRTFVCDNLAFSSDIIVNKKHTLNGRDRFEEGVANALEKIDKYAQAEKYRIAAFRDTPLTEDQSNSIILQAWEQKIVTFKAFRLLLDEYRNPSYDDFRPRTAWSLLSSFTHIIKERQTRYPHRVAGEVIRFQGLLPTSPAMQDPALMI